MKTAFVVLGPHRSGTSSMAGTLALLGATPPQTLLPPTVHNPRGYFESKRIVDFGDEMLSASGSSWQDWQPLTLVEQHMPRWRDAADWLIRVEFGGAETIVLKDPRICRVYPFWEAALISASYRPLILCPVRSPFEVAASLRKRQSIGFAHGLRLWLSHALEAERSTRDKARHFIEWSRFLEDWRSELAQASQRMGHDVLTFDDAAARSVDAFITKDLRRQIAGDPGAEAASIPLVSNTHQALLDLAQYGEQSEIHDRLDALQIEFAQQSALFADAPRAS